MDTGELDLAGWQARFLSASAALQDVRHMLAVGARLAPASGQAPAAVTLLASEAALPSAQRIGVFSGSFNPLTRAHIGVAWAARQELNLDALIWACARVAVDKERVQRAALGDRVAQMEAYLPYGVPGALAVLDAGLYADQAQTLAERLPWAAELWLVIGYDKLVQIFDPRYYPDREAALRRLFAAARLAVAPRGGEGVGAVQALLDDPANRPYAAHVRALAVPAALADLSSTQARVLLSQGDADEAALRGVLPPEGAALGLATRAYAAPATPVPPANSVAAPALDVYGARLAWLAALATLPTAQLDAVLDARPDVALAWLVAATLADDPHGSVARRWLRGERWAGCPATAADLIADLAL